jgi:hypothetical protein
MNAMGKTKGKFDQVSNLSGGQNEILTQLLGQLGGESGAGNIGNLLGGDITGQQSFQEGLGALSGLLTGTGGFDPAAVSQSFQANVADPAIKQFQQELAPSIQQAAVAAGGGRSSAVPARTSQAAERLQGNLSSQLLQQLNQSEQAGLNRQQQAIGQALGFAQAPGNQQLQQLGGLQGLLGLALQPGYQQTTYQPGKKGFGSTIGSVLGGTAGTIFGGPAGGAAGSKIGGSIGGSF